MKSGKPTPIEGARKEKMPEHVRPMLALLSDLPSKKELYGFEYKWDGIRALVFIKDAGLRIETRNLKDITAGYPELAGLPGAMGGRTAVLDGEIVAISSKGYPSFGLLQHRLGATGSKVARLSEDVPVTYMIFDVVYLDGWSLLDVRYADRREVLESLKLDGESWKTPPSNPGEGEAMFETARVRHLEGVVAKKLDSSYQQGARNGEWLKTKLVARQEYVIGGWMPVSRGKGIGSLLIGFYDVTAEQAKKRGSPQRLIYAGKVGSGYTDKDRVDLQRALEKLKRPYSPFADGAGWPGAVYAEPKMVAEVEFRGRAKNHHLRQPAFKGLRTDKRPGEVIEEKQVMS
jgi:bifunctional non-homologous end joining protein LigD